MKSRLGITHPENLCTIAEIYRPSVIFLLLIVWLCLTFAYTQRAPEEAAWVRLCVTVIKSHFKVIKTGTNCGILYANYYYSPLL